MKDKKRMLLIEQLDSKIRCFNEVETVSLPPIGWIKSIRTAIKMSLRQLGKRLNVTPQSIGEMENREANGTITLNSLKEMANALDMKLVYGFIPKDGSIDKMIHKRAMEIANEIVERTNLTMTLEDQQNSDQRIKNAIELKTQELKYEMPRYLWD